MARTSSGLKTFWIVALVTFAAGCAAFTSKNEYWLYRQLMEAKSLEQKAELYRDYMSTYPSGAYSKKIKDVEQEIEFAVYNATGQDKDKIRRYLELFPEGRFTADAKDKITQIEAIEKLKQQEIEAMKKKKDEQTAVADAKRKKFTAEITGALPDWISISASTFVYGIGVNDLAKASARFKELWSSEPMAECGAESCVKAYELAYHYQMTGATRVDRIIRMVVLVKFREGKIWGMSVNFPGRGFIGLRELIEDQPRESTAEELKAAGEFAVDLIAAALQSIVPSGKEVEKEGFLLAYESEAANYYIVRTDIGQAGVVDSLVIQLVPPPPPEPEKKGKKPKVKEPPPPLCPIEDLVFVPQAPAEPTPAPSALPEPPAPATK
jgi:hypothetical protein